jgi:hypothetical protein
VLARGRDMVGETGEPLQGVHGLDRGPRPASSKEVQRPSPGNCT